jgi:hypothetical protein
MIHCYKETKDYSQEGIKREKKLAMDFIWEGLPDSIREKVNKCSLVKELWVKLHNLYFEKYPLTKPENYKEDAIIEQEERCSSCQIDSEEEDCEEGILDLEAELISVLDELNK